MTRTLPIPLAALLTTGTWATSSYADPSAASTDVGLYVANCERFGVTFAELQPLLEVELFSTVGLRVEVHPSGPEAELVVRCTEEDVELIARSWHRVHRNVVDLREVAAETGPRSLALVLVDLYLADAGQAEDTPPAPTGDSIALALSAPASGESASSEMSQPRSEPPASADRSRHRDRPTLQLSLGFDGAVGLAPLAAVPGGRLGLGLRLQDWRVRLFVNVAGLRGQDGLGEIQVVTTGLGLSLAREFVVDDLAFGLFTELRPAALFADATGARPTVRASSEWAGTLDVGLGGYAQWNLLRDFAVRLEGALTYSAIGYEARAMTRRVAGWSGTRIPLRLDLVFSL